MQIRWFDRMGMVVLVLLLVSRSRAEPIVRSPRLPENMPWDLKVLGEPPVLEWIDEQSPVRSLLFAGEPYAGQATRVFAYYASPATLSGAPADGAKYPAVVLVHGGGGTAFREWAELWAKRGYAALAPDLAGYRPHEGANPHERTNRTRLPDGGPDQGDDTKFRSIDKPVGEQWPYHAVASVIRAHSLVRSFPEVDPTRTAVTGISWGGYLTCIVAGVDNRFRAAVPVYGCGFLHDNSAWLPQFAKMTPEQRQRWIQLWEPSQYLPAVSMPILFINGTNDFAYPLDSYAKSYDCVPGEKQIRITVNMPHSHPHGWAPQEIGLFIDHHLRGAPGLPVLLTAQVAGSQIRVAYRSEVPLKTAALHYSTDSGPINTRTWKSSPAKVESDAVAADAPPSDATVWFITATDDRAAIVSTPVSIR